MATHNQFGDPSRNVNDLESRENGPLLNNSAYGLLIPFSINLVKLYGLILEKKELRSTQTSH